MHALLARTTTTTICFALAVAAASASRTHTSDALSSASTSPAGNRFVAFRFERPVVADASSSDHNDNSIERTALAERILTTTAALAIDLRCFGWIQLLDETRVVGEARCPTLQAPTIVTHLQSTGHTAADPNDQLQTHYYAHGKIRFLFPRFRILASPLYDHARTCFHAPPHACANSSAPSDRIAGDHDEL